MDRPKIIASSFQADFVDYSDLFLSDERQHVDVFEQIRYLSQMYNLRDIKTGRITFKSGRKYFGFVQFDPNADQNIKEINFGDKPQNAFSCKKYSRRLRESDRNKIIATHEFAHVLTGSLRNTNEALSVAYWRDLSELWKEYKKSESRPFDQIRHISVYSFKNIDEFHAEAFTEYHLSDRPTQIAIKVGRLIDSYFKNNRCYSGRS